MHYRCRFAIAKSFVVLWQLYRAHLTCVKAIMSSNSYGLRENEAIYMSTAFGNDSTISLFLRRIAIEAEARIPKGKAMFLSFHFDFDCEKSKVTATPSLLLDTGEWHSMFVFSNKFSAWDESVFRKLAEDYVLIDGEAACNHLCEIWSWAKPKRAKASKDRTRKMPLTLCRPKEYYIRKMHKQMGSFAKKANTFRFVRLADDVALVSVCYQTDAGVPVSSAAVLVPEPEMFENDFESSVAVDSYSYSSSD